MKKGKFRTVEDAKHYLKIYKKMGQEFDEIQDSLNKSCKDPEKVKQTRKLHAKYMKYLSELHQLRAFLIQMEIFDKK